MEIEFKSNDWTKGEQEKYAEGYALGYAAAYAAVWDKIHPRRNGRKVLYIDMDGVIADFMKYVKVFHPEIDSYDHDKRERAIDQLCVDNPRAFLTLPPILEGIEVVKDMMHIYDVYFLSTPLNAQPQSYTDKRLWLHFHFGNLSERKLILTHRKDLCIGDYLVDDRTKNGAGEFIGKHIHLWQDEFPTWYSAGTFLYNEHLKESENELRK